MRGNPLGTHDEVCAVWGGRVLCHACAAVQFREFRALCMWAWRGLCVWGACCCEHAVISAKAGTRPCDTLPTGIFPEGLITCIIHGDRDTVVPADSKTVRQLLERALPVFGEYSRDVVDQKVPCFRVWGVEFSV